MSVCIHVCMCVGLVSSCNFNIGKDSEHVQGNVCNVYTTCNLFPSGSSNAVQQCYDQYNTGNDAFGNCGYSGTAFVACAPEDVLCGQLQCDSGNYQRQVNIGVNIRTGRVRANGGIEDCRSFSPLSPPTDFMHPGLVEDGSKCGDERVSISYVLILSPYVCNFSLEEGERAWGLGYIIV